jgi:hypothetical protein
MEIVENQKRFYHLNQQVATFFILIIELDQQYSFFVVVLDIKTCIEEQRTQLPTIPENAPMKSNEQAVV